MKPLLSLLFLLPSLFAHAQDPLIIPSHQVFELRGDSAEVIAKDLIYFPVGEPTEVTYQWDFVAGDEPAEKMITTTILFKPGEEWVEVSNRRTVKLFNRGSLSTTCEFRKSLTYLSQTVMTTQAFSAFQSDNGTVIFGIVSALNDNRGELIKVYKPLYDSIADSLLLSTQFFFPKKYVGTKLTLTWSLDLNEDASVSKRIQFTPESTSSSLDIPVGRLPESFRNGGKALFSIDVFTTTRESIFSGITLELFIRGNRTAETAIKNLDDPYYLSTYSSVELTELLEISSLFETSAERKIRKGLINRTDQLAFLNRFWMIREKKEERWLPTFFELRDRISIARTSRFEYLGTPFFQTDRGRILLIYGIPDQVEKVPFEIKTIDVELWEYHTIENGVEFVFVDLNRNKEFRLVHSTKNGEVYNPDYDEEFKRDKPGFY